MDDMLRRFARDLRQVSPDAEIRLWAALRDRRLAGHRFRRQHPIGPYIADFACPDIASLSRPMAASTTGARPTTGARNG